MFGHLSVLQHFQMFEHPMSLWRFQMFENLSVLPSFQMFELLSFQRLPPFLKLCKLLGFAVALGGDAFGEGTKSYVRKKSPKSKVPRICIYNK